MGWNVNPERAIKKLNKQVEELERYLDHGTVWGQYFYSCKDCGGLFHKVTNIYAKHGMCSNCWRKIEAEKLKKEMNDLIGFSIVDFTLKFSDIINSETPRLETLVLEKDGKRRILRAEQIQHFLI